MWLVYLIALIIVDVVADIFTKQNSLSRSNLTWILSIFAHLLVGLLWLLTMRYKSQLAISGNIFSLATALCATLIGLVIFNEHISHFNMVGVILGLISLIFLLS